MNICFVSNFKKTLVFNNLAKVLFDHYGFNIYWIVVNKDYKDYLREQWPEERILYIHKGLSYSAEPIGEYKINEIIKTDRFLNLDKRAGIKFLRNIQSPIYEFLSINKVRAVFGEITWSHEILISRLLNDKKELNCNYFSPLMTRIPEDRFFFFPNEYNDIETDTNIDYQSLKHPIINLVRPEYIKIFDQIIETSYTLKAKLNRIKRFITKENVEKNDPSVVYTTKYRLKIGLRQEINRATYKLLRTIDIDYLNRKKFILYTLHVQPESSIDVQGKYYNDQYYNVLNIWKLLPNDYLLIIKEHSNGIGDRRLSFYKRLSRLPNLFFINEGSNSHELIKMSEAVFTVSGTIAYEAALMKKTSFTFAPVFFNKLQFCHKISIDDFDASRNLFELISVKNSMNPKKMNLSEFSNFVYHHSFKGEWEPTTIGVMSSENILSLANAINFTLTK